MNYYIQERVITIYFIFSRSLSALVLWGKAMHPVDCRIIVKQCFHLSHVEECYGFRLCLYKMDFLSKLQINYNNSKELIGQH